MKQEIPWNRFAVEAIVIVASILLAFAIDAWWNRFQEQEYRVELLSRIESALTENVELLEAHLDLLSRAQEPLHAFLALNSNQMPELTSDEARQMIGVISRPASSPFNNDILLSLFSTGNSTLALDAILQDGIAEWRNQENSLERKRAQIAVQEQEALRVLGKYSEIRPFMPFSPDDVSPTSGGVEAIRTALNDPDIVSLANAKAYNWSIFELNHNNLKQQSESLISIIATLYN